MLWESGYETSVFVVATCSPDIKTITGVQVPFELIVIECCAMNENLLVSSFEGKKPEL